MEDDDLGGMLTETRSNAIVSWAIVVVLFVTFVVTALEGAFDWVLIIGLAITVLLVPTFVYRDPYVMPPWELMVIVAVPLLWHTFRGHAFVTDVVMYLAVAALALVIAVELHQFTAVRMNRPFAIVLVVLTTLAVAGIWNSLLWLVDVTLGTSLLLDGRSQSAINYDVMLDFIFATVAGIGGGLVFELYFRSPDRSPSERTYVPPKPLPDDETGSKSQKLHDRIGISLQRQRQISRAMQVLLVFVLLAGLYDRDLPTVANSAVALTITFLPAFLKREFDITMDAGLVLWITLAVFLATLGTAALYDMFGPWDRLTHMLSASVVAAAGYAFFRSMHVHTDHIYIPPKVMGIFILIFVLAAGVIWEILEFVIDQIAIALEIDAILSQYGVNDTIVDLLFNVVGAVIVTLWGTAYLTDVSDYISDELDQRYEAE